MVRPASVKSNQKPPELPTPEASVAVADEPVDLADDVLAAPFVDLGAVVLALPGDVDLVLFVLAPVVDEEAATGSVIILSDPGVAVVVHDHVVPSKA